MGNIIDGKRIAAQIRAEIAESTKEFIARTGIRPGLAVIIVETTLHLLFM